MSVPGAKTGPSREPVTRRSGLGGLCAFLLFAHPNPRRMRVGIPNVKTIVENSWMMSRLEKRKAVVGRMTASLTSNRRPESHRWHLSRYAYHLANPGPLQNRQIATAVLENAANAPSGGEISAAEDAASAGDRTADIRRDVAAARPEAVHPEAARPVAESTRVAAPGLHTAGSWVPDLAAP